MHALDVLEMLNLNPDPALRSQNLHVNEIPSDVHIWAWEALPYTASEMFEKSVNGRNLSAQLKDHLDQVRAVFLRDLSPTPKCWTNITKQYPLDAAGWESHVRLSRDITVFWELQPENQLSEPSVFLPFSQHAPVFG